MARKKDFDTYRYNDDQIEVLPYFLYEVDLYRIEPMRANLLASKFIKSNKLLDVEEVKVIKRFKNLSIDRFVTLLGAPKSFIEENNLPKYELKKKKKNEKRTR